MRLRVGVFLCVLSTGGCADNCIGRWTYQQFAYFPRTEGSGTEKWTHQLELRFSQNENVGFGVRNTKFLKIYLRDRNYHEIDTLCITFRAGYVYANIDWNTSAEISIRLEERRPEAGTDDRGEATLINRFVLRVREDTGRLELQE